MAKKQAQKTPKSNVTETPDNTAQWLPWLLAGVAFVLYSTGFSNEMSILYDKEATIANPAVKNFLVFSGFNLGMYAPVTWIGYQIAYVIGKESPNMYHILSAVVHAVNVVLVFRLMMRLNTGLTAAALVALFFGIHPLQVESVAWIAGFSTPLFSMFSLLSMHYYLRYASNAENGLGKHYWVSIGMFLLACLAKSAAVTLPLTLLVLDWWKKRPINTKVLLEKGPFFLISLGFGLLTLYSRQFAGQPNQPADFNLLDRGLMACHSIVFYWKKLLFPMDLSIWYPFVKTEGTWTWDYYAAPFLLFGILFLAWRSRHAWPIVWVAVLFYLSNIALSLPWSTFGVFELRADRYNYLASIGFFALLAHLPALIKDKKPTWGTAVWGLLLGLAFTWLITSALRIRDWKNTTSLIETAIAATGDNFGKAYLLRGMSYGKASDAQKAIQDFSRALQLNPDLYEAYKFRGNIFGMLKNYDQSVDDLSKFLERYPEEVPELYNRGLSYANLEKNQEAIADFTTAIALDTTFARLYRARGNCLLKMGETEKGNADLKKWDALK